MQHIIFFLFPSAELKMQAMSHLLDKIFLIFPNYCLGMSFSQFYQNYEFITFCTHGIISEAMCKALSEYNLTCAAVCCIRMQKI